MLEALAHITMLPVKQPFCLIRLSVPENFEVIDMQSLPSDWQQQPPPDTLRKYGDVFATQGKALALKVPSVLVPDNFNFLINPHHLLFSKIKKIAVSNISFDQRLFSNKS